MKWPDSVDQTSDNIWRLDVYVHCVKSVQIRSYFHIWRFFMQWSFSLEASNKWVFLWFELRSSNGKKCMYKMTPKNMKFNLNVIEKLPVVSTSFLGYQSVQYRFSQDMIFNKYLLNFEMSCFSAKLNLIFLTGQRCGLRECILHLVFNFLAGCLIN